MVGSQQAQGSTGRRGTSPGRTQIKSRVEGQEGGRTESPAPENDPATEPVQPIATGSPPPAF